MIEKPEKFPFGKKSILERKDGIPPGITVLENHRKNLIQHSEQSELSLHFGQKFIKGPKGQNWSILVSF